MTEVPSEPRTTPTPVMLGRAGRALVAWYRREGRHIPDREVADPWRVLVLEVMSQQTQIERALGAARRFCERFPEPRELARATPADAVRAWAGLGYNRRALALWRAAREIEDAHAGVVPGTVEALDALPGIGPYTARAVAATAFGQPVAPLDVNAARVVSRVAGRAAGSPGSLRSLQPLADGLIAADAPADSVRALMDLAVLVCTRRRPACERCPIACVCASAGKVDDGPRAGAVPRSRGGDRAAAPPFPATRRWLRGALLREVVAAEPGVWLEVAGGRGEHGPLAVREALLALESDGLVELDPAGRARLAGDREG